MAVSYAQLVWLGFAEVLLTLFGLAALGTDLAVRATRSTRQRRGIAVALGIAGCAVACGWLVMAAPDGAAPGGMLVGDAVTRWMKVLLLLLTAGALVVSLRADIGLHIGEYVAVVLFGTVGLLLVVSTENVLLLFLSLELASVSLYILTGFARRDARSMEAALKYFLFGSMAAAFLLFGFSLLYGVTGAVSFGGVGAGLRGQPVSALLLVGLVMLLVGFGFKAAAAPFHFWAPDAYEGAPTPVAALIGAGSKVAAFFVLAKFSHLSLGAVLGSAAWGHSVLGWAPLVACVAAVSMIVGNLAALAQHQVKRILAYSAVAHAGYTLVGIVGGGSGGVAAILFYVGTYAVTALGAFAVLGWLEREAGGSEVRHLVGLSRRSPVMAASFGVFILSLAGIPPLSGFLAKFQVFLAALRTGSAETGGGLVWLVALGAATTCVSFYYYLRLLKAAFVDEPVLPGEMVRGRLDPSLTVVVVVSAVVVTLTGCVPALFLTPLARALAAVGLG